MPLVEAPTASLANVHMLTLSETFCLLYELRSLKKDFVVNLSYLCECSLIYRNSCALVLTRSVFWLISSCSQNQWTHQSEFTSAGSILLNLYMLYRWKRIYFWMCFDSASVLSNIRTIKDNAFSYITYTTRFGFQGWVLIDYLETRADFYTIWIGKISLHLVQ